MILYFSTTGLAYSGKISLYFGCAQNCCVEGQTTSIVSDIKNEGNESFVVGGFKVLNQGENIILEKNLDSITINPGETESLIIEDYTLPGPTADNSLYYKSCLNYTDTGWVCSDNLKILELIAKSNHECNTNSDCDDNEFCKKQGCISECELVLEESCGYTKKHKWFDYECCSNDNCPSDSQCLNHECVTYDCTTDDDCGDQKYCKDRKCVAIICECGKIEGHKCVGYDCCEDDDCQNNEYCEKYVCKRYGCMTDDDCESQKYCKAKECVDVNCKCGKIENHKCIEFDCCDNENCKKEEHCTNNKCQAIVKGSCGYIKNHKWAECNQNQKCSDNKCVDLFCHTPYTAKNHECKISWVYIGATLFILLVVFVAFLYFKKSRMR